MRKRTDGFTLVELMVVVLVIGIVVAVAVPVFNAAKANAEKNTCFANQRTLESAAQAWVAGSTGRSLPQLVLSLDTCFRGTPNAESYTGNGLNLASVPSDILPGDARLLVDGYLKKWPRCPSVAINLNAGNLNQMQRYTFNADGAVIWYGWPYPSGCNVHGHY